MSFLFQSNPINVIAKPRLDRSDGTSVDIIALHGLGGVWDASWTADGYCWLSQALSSKFPSNRIVSMNYPTMLRDLAAGSAALTDLLLELIREREESHRTDTPIVFIGHSFGGTVLKQMYVVTHPSNSSNPTFHHFHRLLRGYVYLGTPHTDIRPPDVPKLWRALCAEAVTSLGAKSPDLEKAIFTMSEVNHAFRRLGGEDLASLCFYETEKTLVGISKVYIVNQAEAALVGRAMEAIPLHLRHQHLGRYRNDKDVNLQRVIKSLDSLLANVNISRLDAVRTAPSRTRRLKLLSLDGGGVKGYFTILIIRKLIEEAQRLEGNTTSRKRSCDYFDLIGGTSTGGLLAIMLGRLRMDASSCIVAYQSLSRRVFYRNSWLHFLRPLHTAANMVLGLPWFSGDLLKSVVQQTVEENLGADERECLVKQGHEIKNTTLISPESQGSCCFVCAVPAGQRRVERIRSYRSISSSARDTGKYTIWEAARATSAAPLYFPAINVQGRDYFDGGLDSNNPVVEVIEEARKEFPGAVIDTVVSIGTGKGTIPDPVPPFTNVLHHFINRSTDTEQQHDRVMAEPVFADVRDGYFRFQGETDLGEIDLSDADKLDEIERLANVYLASSVGKHMIASCAARLVER